MDTVNYSVFRQNLAGILDKVAKDHAPIMITRKNGEDAVVMSSADFRSYEETAYLMASSRNAEILNQSIEDLENGEGEEFEMITE